MGAPMGAKKVQKRVSGASPVIIGQLDHNVVFGTKSGAIQDLQRGKKWPIGGKRTPPWPMLTPLDPSEPH